MGVIFVKDPETGINYSVNIAGSEPTPKEQTRINDFLSKKRTQTKLAPTITRPAAPQEPDTSFKSAFISAIDQPLENFATTARLTGFDDTAEFLSGLTEAPEQYQSATEQFLNESGEGFKLGYMPRAVVEQAGQFAGSMLSRAGGAAVGAAVTGGNPFGAVAGGLAGPALFEAVQLLGPIAEERAKNNGREIPNKEDWLGSLSSASASGALNAIAPGLSGLVRKIVVEAGTEGLQSIIQQTGETALTEKGLEIKPKQAIGEAILGGGSAGVIAAPIELARGKQPKESDTQLTQDLREFDEEGRERLGYASQISKDLAADSEAQTEAAIQAENPQAKESTEDPMSFSEVTTNEEFRKRTFDKAQYDRVLQQIKADIARDRRINVSRIHQDVKRDIAGTKVSQVRDILKELESRGYLQSRPVTKKPSAKGKKPPLTYQPTQNLVPQLKTPDVSYRRQIDISNEAIEKNNKIISNLTLDRDSVREYGRDLQGRRISEKAINYEITRLSKRNTQYKQVIGNAQRGLQRLGRLPYVPTVTPEFNASVNLDRKIAAAKARAVADKVKEKVQSNQPVFSSRMNEKQNKVAAAIRRRLNKYGLKDVNLNLGQVVRGAKLDDPQDVSEGLYNPSNRVISLSMGLYDPKLSEKELFDRVGEVLDHETTHALKHMNVITPDEWNTLTNAASKTKYVKNKAGKTETRKYSYLDRAKRMYSDQSEEIQAEEAVAEMFRDYNAGRLRIGGKPKNLLNKVRNFFKSIIGGTVDSGFSDVSSIFEGINIGEIGARRRPAPTEESIKVEEEVDPDNLKPRHSRLARSPNIPSLQSFIKDNPDGYTISADTFEFVEGGYVVAPVKEAEIITGQNLPEEVLLGYIEDNKDIAKILNRPVYLGGWLNEEDGQYYLDSTIITPTKEEALYIANGAEQIAIFDLNNFEEINTSEGIRELQQSGAYSGDTAIGYRIRSKEIGRRFEEARDKRNALEREQLTGRIKVIPLTTAEKESLSADFQRVIDPSVNDNPDIFKAFFLDDEYAREILAELRSPTRDIAGDPAKLSEVQYLRNEIYGLTQEALKDLPNEIKVYRYGPLNERDGVTSFTLDPFYGGSNPSLALPWISGKNYPLETYTVKKSDILAAPDLIRDFGEDEVIIRNDAVKKSGIRQSRLTLRLTPEQRAASILDYLDPNTGEPKFRNKEGSETLVSFANKLLQLRGARAYDIINSEQDREEVARIMAAEGEAALLSSSDALGWYDTTLKLAKQTLFPVYPEVSPTRPDGTDNPLHDPASEHAFDYATAVTSNGLSVIDNYLLAARQYDAWKNSQDGKFPLSSSGKQGQSMIKAWEFWNALTNLGYDSNQIAELLTTQVKKGDLGRMMTEVFGVDRIKDLPFAIDGKELASETVGVAYVIGPKIGNGFYQNLRGNFDPLTMDRWWMRFANRVTGNPIEVHNEETLQKNKDDFFNLMSNPDQLSEMDRDLLATAMDEIGVTTLEKSDIELLAPQIMKTWDKSFYNKAYNDKLNELSDQYDFQISGSRITGKDASKVKKIAQDARPKSTPLARAGKLLAEKLVPSLQEDPRSASDRAAMRAATNRAREILREGGVDISNADFQALMWYAEKRIFAAGGVRKGRGDDNDYADGAIAILKKKGISNDKIEAALPKAERGRISTVELELERDSEVGAEIDTIQETTRERSFFSPRELKLADYSDSVQAEITPEQRAEIARAEVEPNLPPQRYQSRLLVFDPETEPTAEDYRESYMLTRVPVKESERGQTPSPVYGKILEGNKERVVVLPKGLQNNHSNGIQDGHGLIHIQQRNHDKDLFMNSKYGRVEEAIRDLMERWRRQDFQDGEDVISYQNQNRLVLEWRKNISNGSPPLRLVLERGSNVSTRGKQVSTLQPNFYYVKTFFPVLEKKSRKTYNNSPMRYRSRLFSRLAEEVETKQYDLNYARASDTIAKGLGLVLGKDKAQAAADTIITKFQDNMLPIGRMIQELKDNGANIADAFDPYLQEELYHGRVGAEIDSREQTIYKDAVDAVKGVNISQEKVNQLKSLSDGASETGKGFVSQALDRYRSNKLVIADAVLYATHAKERNAYISRGDPSNKSGSGMTNTEADAILSWVATLDNANIEALRNVQARARSIVADTNQARADYGLIPEDLRTDKNFRSYVPLRGKVDPVDPETDYSRPSRGSPFGVRGREDRRAFGRQDYAADILATVINQNQNSVSRGERNKVGQAFIKLLQAEPQKTRGFGRILDRLPTRKAESSSGKFIDVIDRDAANRDDIFVAKVDGKDVYVQVADARLARSLKGEDGTGASSLNAINRSLGKLNRYLSNINTSYNPEFFITNILRDIQTAGVNVQQFDAENMVKEIGKTYGSAFKGIKRAIRDNDTESEWAKIYREFVRDGGQNSANPMRSVADQMENISGLLDDIAEDGARGKFNKMKNSFAGEKAKSVLKFLEDYNTVAENAIRVATYQGLKNKGFSPQRAAQAARNVTVNFGKGGEYKTLANSLYLFYNASIQGTFALMNAFIKSPRARRLWGLILVSGVVQDQLAAAFGEEDEDGILLYDKIPDYILEHNIIIPTNGVIDRTYIKIPMPYGLNMAFNAGRSFSRAMRGQYSASEATYSTIMTAVDALNPLGGTENMYNFAFPTVADPFIDIARNKDFSGAPIYKEPFPGDELTPDSQKYFNSVSPSTKWITDNINSLTGGTSEISGFVDWNPEIMDFWLQYLTGGVGRFVQRTAELPARVYTEGFTEELIREVPLVRKAVGEVSDRENVARFVDKRDRILQIGKELKAAMDSRDRARLMKAREKYPEEIALLPRVKAISNAIKKISRKANAVRDNEMIPDAQKQLILERLDQQKQFLYARANEMMKDYN